MDGAIAIFIGTYVLIAVGQPPLFRIDRTGAAVIGASLMVVTGVLGVTDAYAAVDYRTILVLFGMMVMIANLRLSGFFSIVMSRVLRSLRTPRQLLFGLIAVSGVLSALFVNDTICLVFTPFVLDVTERLRLDPRPYLIALCMSANIGSAATIIGNPQNIIIGSYSGISFARFLAHMTPVALTGLVICAAVIAWVYRRELSADTLAIVEHRVRFNRALVVKTLVLSAAAGALFLAGAPMEVVAVGVASVLLVTRRVKPEKVYALIDFRLLVLFIGLFIVIRGIEQSEAAMSFLRTVGGRVAGDTALFAAASAVISNLVSNVPAVLLFKPLLTVDAGEKAWLVFSMSSTFAGNLTILGSIANIIVVESAAPRMRIGFFEYCKVGVPVTLLTVTAGLIVLNLLF